MRLPFGDQRVLKKIEGSLEESDPRLNSLFVIFGRLTDGEAMPWVEKVRRRRLAARLTRLLVPVRGVRPAARARALLLLPVALATTMCAVVIGVGFPGARSGSGHATRAPAARELVVKPRGCARFALLRVPLYGC